MIRFKGILARLRSATAPRVAESRMEEEFRFHVDMETRRLVAEDLPEDEARRRALVAFGGLEHHREVMRDERGTRWLEDLGADVRFAFRAMRRRPGFALAVALTLGVGVGINGIIFGFVNSLLLRPLPARDPEQLVGISQCMRSRGKPIRWHTTTISICATEVVCSTGSRDEPMARSTWSSLIEPATRAMREKSGGAMVWGEFVTENYFTVLGVQPVLGRLFTTEDAPQGANPFAVLSYLSWKRRFQGDSTVVGRIVRINGTEFTIVGIAPHIVRP